jgi:hypothetical protein
MAKPAVPSIVRPVANQDVVETLEAMLEEARRGEFTALVAFKLSQLPRAIGTSIAGSPSEADVVLAIERWKVNQLVTRDQ